MAYPRDYLVPNWDVNPETVFIVMPINSDFDMTLGLITEVCESLGIKAQRADDITKQDFIMANILEGIARSEIIIVDITGGNPNVFYELGIAHTLRAKHSIIIITQEADIVKKTPFDVRHWSILNYSNSNKPLFKASLKNRIIECRKHIDVDEFINRLLRNHAFESALILQFIDAAKQINIANLELSCCILSDNVSTHHCYRDKIIDLNNYLTTLGDYKDGQFQKIMWLLKYLLFTSDFILSQYIDTIKLKFLKEWQRDSIYMGSMDYWELVANICCKIIEKKHKDKSDAIEWLIKYLNNPRMGRIDKVRTKIEDFILNIKDKELDNAIVNLLISNNRTAKESAVDICGQKPIFEAVNYLIQLMQNETDPHIVRSCINALARMNITMAAPIILNWMKKNRDKWGAQAVSATLMEVAQKALQMLDQNTYSQLITLKEE